MKPIAPTNDSSAARSASRPLAARALIGMVVLAACAAVAGCHTNDAALKSADALAKDLGAYRADQTRRLDDVNRHYRFDYARLIDEMTRLRLDELNQFFTLATMEATAQVLSDWENATLPKRIRDRIQESVNDRRQRILEVDKSIEAARNAYADAYQAVQLNLALLKSAQADVESLAIREDRKQTAVEFVQTVARIINDLNKDAEKAAGVP
jgi:hypothetical protein